MHLNYCHPYLFYLALLAIINVNQASVHQQDQAAAATFSSSSLSAPETNQHLPSQGDTSDQLNVTILALFTGAPNDLGLDHRLGRQVLKLAAARAHRLYPEVANIELVIHNDDSACNNASDISIKVAEQFYLDHHSSWSPSSLLSYGQEEEVEGDQWPGMADCPELAPNTRSPGNSGAPFYSPNQSDDSDQCNDESELRLLSAQRNLSSGEAGGAAEQQPSGAAPPRRRIDAILGPSCDKQIDMIARMAAYWRTPIYTVTPTSGLFNRKDIYPTLTRLSPSLDHMSLFIVKVMERFRWRHLAIVVDPSHVGNSAFLQTLDRAIDRLRYSIPIESNVFTLSTTTSTSPSSRASNSTQSSEQLIGASSMSGGSGVGPGDHLNSFVQPTRGARQSQCSGLAGARNVLEGVRRVARVVLFLVNDPKVVRQLLLCAHELHFDNGEYTFFALNMGLKSTSQSADNHQHHTTTTNNDGTYSTGGANGVGATSQDYYWFVPDDEENNLKARQMFESLMVFSAELPIGDEFTMFVDQTLDMARSSYPDVSFQPISVGQIAVALHDSLLLAVEAKRRFWRLAAKEPTSGSMGTTTNNTESSGGQAVALMWNERFVDGLMTNMAINSNGDQELNYVLSDMEPELGIMRPVASYSREARQVEMLANGYIHWPARWAGSSSIGSASSLFLSLNDAGRNEQAYGGGGGMMMMSQSEEPPPDEPECGFTGDAERCIDRQNMYTALTIVSLFLVSVLAILIMSFKRYERIKYQMELDNYWWRISWNDLQFIEAHRSSIHSNMETGSVDRLRTRVVVAGSKRRGPTNKGAACSHDGSLVSSHGGRSLVRPSSARVPSGSAPANETTDNKAAAAKNDGPVVDVLGKGIFKSIKNIQSKHQSNTPVSLVVTPARSESIPDDDDRAGEPRAAKTGIEPRAAAASAATGVSLHHDDDDKFSRADSHRSNQSLLVRSELSAVIRGFCLALYKDEVVIVKQLNGHSVEVPQSLLIELKSMRELSHENLARLIGLCIEPDRLAIVYEYCSRGNLQDLLLNQDISIDWNLKYSIIGDILNGLHFIHTTLLDFHGRLKSTNLVLDSRFTVKLTDFGLKSLYNQLDMVEELDDDMDNENNRPDVESAVNCGAGSGVGNSYNYKRPSETDDELEGKLRRQSSTTQTIYNMDSVSMRAENLNTPTFGNQRTGTMGTSAQSSWGSGIKMHFKNRGSVRFFWTAPEHLRERQPHLAGSRRGDIYSLAIILFEILTRKEPYYYGTNAKPRWKVIKHEKLRHQRKLQHQQHNNQQQEVQPREQQQANKSQVSGQASSLINANVSSTQRNSLKQSIFSRSRKRQQNQATVAPLKEDNHEEEEEEEEQQQQQLGHTSGQAHELGRGSVSSTEREKFPDSAVRINVRSPTMRGEDGSETETICEDENEDQVSSITSRRSSDRQDLPAATPPLSPKNRLAGGSATGSVSSRIDSHSVVGSRVSTTRLKRIKSIETQVSQQLVTGAGAELDAEEILDQLRMGVRPEPVRPYIPNFLLADVDAKMMDLIRSCWSEEPGARPSSAQVRQSMRKITKGATAKNYLDNLLDRLQTYAAQLERIVDFRSADIVAEKMRTEELLYQLVPRFVADKLKQNEPIMPQVFDGVTILFSDIVGFEKYASVMSPCELVDLLNNIYSSFDSIISSFDVTKIEVILDQYLVAAGISLQQQQQQQLPNMKQEQSQSARQQNVANVNNNNNKQKNQTEPSSQDQDQKGSALADAATGRSSGAGAASGAPAVSAKSKRRLMKALRGSQASNGKKDKYSSVDSRDKTLSESQEAKLMDNSPAAGAGGGESVSDLDHYKRSSAEQIARMALCIRDLVKSFHFRQNLASCNKTTAVATTTRNSQQQNDDAAGLASSSAEKASLEQQNGADKLAQKPSGDSFVASTFNIRIGIHSGKVCAGIVGLKRPKFCLIGDTVNVASRMHTNSKANRIQISADTRELLKRVTAFNIDPRGRIEIKGKGLMDTYWLESAYQQ